MFPYFPPKPEKPVTQKIRDLFGRVKNAPMSQLDVTRELFPKGWTLAQGETVLLALRRLHAWGELTVDDEPKNGVVQRTYRLSVCP